eukprot:SAG22_NODE_673_length_7973_cov_3.643129_1_plen_461_part_00
MPGAARVGVGAHGAAGVDHRVVALPHRQRLARLAAQLDPAEPNSPPALATSEGATGTARRPNILVIMADQQSKFVLGCYSDQVVRTPHLDRLAREGLRFDSAYCPSPVCMPSRMSFMTGCTPSTNGIHTNLAMLPSDRPTWAHALGIGGYETALLGRMHFEGVDQHHGFESRPCGEMWAVHPGMMGEVLPPTEYGLHLPSGQQRHTMSVAGSGPTAEQWMDQRVTEHSCEWLRAKGVAAAGETTSPRPWAAVVGYVLPHNPYVAPRHLVEHYFDKVTVPENPDVARQPPMTQWYRASRDLLEPFSELRARTAIAAYYALCELHDQHCGAVLAALEESGQADNTLVIYVSDHGEMLGQHGCWTKNTYYEGSVGVPMLIRWPGHTAANQVSSEVCSLLDLAPTIVDVAAATAGAVGPAPVPGSAFEGSSLLPSLLGQADGAAERVAFSEVMDQSNQSSVQTS